MRPRQPTPNLPHLSPYIPTYPLPLFPTYPYISQLILCVPSHPYVSSLILMCAHLYQWVHIYPKLPFSHICSHLSLYVSIYPYLLSSYLYMISFTPVPHLSIYPRLSLNIPTYPDISPLILIYYP